MIHVIVDGYEMVMMAVVVVQDVKVEVNDDDGYNYCDDYDVYVILVGTLNHSMIIAEVMLVEEMDELAVAAVVAVEWADLMDQIVEYCSIQMDFLELI